MHTPGPWTATNSSWEESIVTADNKLIAKCPIDFMASEETQDQYERLKEANARLIAAAPTMYTYIASRAADGDEQAAQILKSIHG